MYRGKTTPPKKQLCKLIHFVEEVELKFVLILIKYY